VKISQKVFFWGGATFLTQTVDVIKYAEISFSYDDAETTAN